MITVRPIKEEDVLGFRAALDSVCRERTFLAALEVPSEQSAAGFVRKNVERGYPQFVAESGCAIVGWCDAIPGDPSAGTAHVGYLGMPQLNRSLISLILPLIVLLKKTKPNNVSHAPMKTLLLATACFLPLVLMAQNPVPRQPRPRVDALSQHSGEAEGLKENITIRLQGTTTTGSDIDLSLTGIGPRFTADQVANDDTVLNCQYVVSETETGYRVSYSVSARIKVATQTNPATPNFEFRDVSISGTVLCLADRPKVLVRNGSKPLQLTIIKEPENGGEQPAPRPEPK